jgi:hypothetical protein
MHTRGLPSLLSTVVLLLNGRVLTAAAPADKSDGLRRSVVYMPVITGSH